MPSIALFFSTHTYEKELKEELINLTHLSTVTDEDVIHDAAILFSASEEKLSRALYQKTSVFNKFTLERELKTAYMKFALAKRLHKSGQLISGFTMHLIPKGVTHVVKVLVADDKSERISRMEENGINRKDAEKQIRKDDVSAYQWTDFLFEKEAWDKSLYDIVIPAHEMSPKDAAKFISEQSAQGNLLESPESIQAVQDMVLAAEVEINLLRKGQKVNVEACQGHIQLNVNKSVLNFNALTKELTESITDLEGVKEVKVAMGREYQDSIYRDQEFKLPPKVLLVDDEKDFALTLSERLIARNVGSYAVYGGQEALDFITEDKPDVMVLDLKMPGVNGMEVLEKTKKENPDIEIIILTGHGSEEDKKNCLELGAFAYLQKPTDIQTLSDTIRKAHEKSVDSRLAV